MTRPYRRWTAAENAIVCEMTSAGATTNEIGAALGRTSQSVESQKRKLGLSKRIPPSRDIVDTVIARFESGDMKTRIARDLGISLRSVAHIVLANGIVNSRSVNVMRSNPLQPDTLSIHEMRLAGMSIKEIAVRVGKTPATVRRAVLRVERRLALDEVMAA